MVVFHGKDHRVAGYRILCAKKEEQTDIRPPSLPPLYDAHLCLDWN